MSTANIINNMNFLPSNATAVEKEEAPKKELLANQAKFWRFTGSDLAVQPTGGYKAATKKTKAVTKPLNFERLYVGFVIDGQIKGGFTLAAKDVFELCSTGIMPTLQDTLVKYLENIKQVDATLTPEQKALLA